MMNYINPFDIMSGKVVQNRFGTFWFKEPGNNIRGIGWPIYSNLHNEDGPAYISGSIKLWFINGKEYDKAQFLDYIAKNKS